MKLEKETIIQEAINMVKGILYTTVITGVLAVILNMSSCSLLDNIKGMSPLDSGSAGSLQDSDMSTEEVCLDIINNLTKNDSPTKQPDNSKIEEDAKGYVSQLESAYTHCATERNDLGEKYSADMTAKEEEINKLVEERDFYKNKFEEIQSVFSDIGGETETTEDTQ